MNMDKHHFTAGTAKVDITPGMGVQLAGDIGRQRPAEWVEDPLYARALVMSDGGHTLCLLALDLTAITRPWADAIRQGVAQATGCTPEAVMVHATQSHSAPCLGYSMAGEASARLPAGLAWLRGGDDRYHDFAVGRAIQAARQAAEKMAPVRVGWAYGVEGRVAYNRRFVMRDGRVKTHPPNAHPEILHVEGPVDPELGMLVFQAEDLAALGMLLNYTCHPTHGYPHRWVSADWPGAWANEMDKACQAGCAALATNGWCGNIHHTNHLDPEWKDDYHRMARTLVETTHKILRNGLSFLVQPRLDARTLHVRLPKRRLTQQESASAQALLSEHPEPIWLDAEKTSIRWDWVYALSRLDYLDECQHEPDYDFLIQVFRIGEAVLVGVPGEPFVEGQLRLKRDSPARPTYVLHMCNDAAGYIPTPQAFRGGGYETETAAWSFLGPEALDRVVDSALGLVREVVHG
jgi:hypothetical protein